VIEPLGSFFGAFRFWFVRSLESALSGYDEGRQKFLRRLFELGKEWRGTLTIDTDEAAAALDCDRAEVVEALLELKEAGDVNMRPYGVRQRYRIVERPAGIGAVVTHMQELFQRREGRDVERLRGVVALAEGEGCVVRRLLEYFGETPKRDCGECSRCTGEQVGESPLPGRGARQISAEEVEIVHALSAEKHAALRSPRQLARFLCGIPSPAATRERLGGHDAFALLEEVAFQDVLVLAESLNEG
jgi:ATP-dependent DNA helicase RecQ